VQHPQNPVGAHQGISALPPVQAGVNTGPRGATTSAAAGQLSRHCDEKK